MDAQVLMTIFLLGAGTIAIAAWKTRNKWLSPWRVWRANRAAAASAAAGAGAGPSPAAPIHGTATVNWGHRSTTFLDWMLWPIWMVSNTLLILGLLWWGWATISPESAAKVPTFLEGKWGSPIPWGTLITLMVIVSVIGFGWKHREYQWNIGARGHTIMSVFSPAEWKVFFATLVVLAAMYIIALNVDPHFTTAFTAAYKGLAVLSLAAALVAAATAKYKWKGAISSIMAVLFVGTMYKGSCAPGDTACIQNRQETVVRDAAIKARDAARRDQPSANQHCPGLMVPVTFKSTPVQINPNGQCTPDLYYEEQNVVLYAKQAGSTKIHTVRRGEWLPSDTEYVWSAGAPLEARYMLSPRRVTKFLEWRDP